jgi:hypothetical protein
MWGTFANGYLIVWTCKRDAASFPRKKGRVYRRRAGCACMWPTSRPPMHMGACTAIQEQDQLHVIFRMPGPHDGTRFQKKSRSSCVHTSNLRRAIALDLYSSVGAARTIMTFQWTRRYDCFESCHARADILYYLYIYTHKLYTG